MSDLKSEHLWAMIDASRHSHSPDDASVSRFVVWAMLDDIRTLQARIAELQEVIRGMGYVTLYVGGAQEDSDGE